MVLGLRGCRVWGVGLLGFWEPRSAYRFRGFRGFRALSGAAALGGGFRALVG